MALATRSIGLMVCLSLAPIVAQAQEAPKETIAARSLPVRAAGPNSAVIASTPTRPDNGAPKAPQRPGSEDPLSGIGNRISAVLDLAGSPHLLIVETDHGVADTRDLVIGDEYKAGWELSAVAPTSFTMRKGSETRQIAINMEAPRPAPVAPVPTVRPAAPVVAMTAGAPNQAVALGNFAGRGGNGAPGAAVNGGALALGGQQGLGRGMNIDPAQAAAMASQLQGVLANLPQGALGGVAGNPQAAAFLGALQGGAAPDMTALISQFQGGAAPDMTALINQFRGGAGGGAAGFFRNTQPGGQ